MSPDATPPPGYYCGAHPCTIDEKATMPPMRIPMLNAEPAALMVGVPPCGTPEAAKAHVCFRWMVVDCAKASPYSRPFACEYGGANPDYYYPDVKP